MQNNNDTNPVTIEQFAAFLDGNLSEPDMQAVASAIDARQDLSAILREVIKVDDATAPLAGMSNPYADLPMPEDEDFVLPIIPSPAPSSDTIPVWMSTEPTEAVATVAGSAETISSEEGIVSFSPHSDTPDDAGETPESFDPEDNDFQDLDTDY